MAYGVRGKVRCGMGKPTLGGQTWIDAVAPFSVVRLTIIGRLKSTRNGRSVWAISA
jgi:hypothetical protein